MMVTKKSVCSLGIPKAGSPLPLMGRAPNGMRVRKISIIRMVFPCKQLPVNVSTLIEMMFMEFPILLSGQEQG